MVGTFLLNEFGKQSFAHAHYLNFEKTKAANALFDEDLDPKKIIQRLNFFFQTSILIADINAWHTDCLL
jgi:hypothetical protein